MKYRLMDLLACPICKAFPLKLYVCNLREVKPPERVKPCELYCAYHGSMLKELGEEPRCRECYGKEIVDGLLLCPNCGRWYPIEEEIPRLLPDELRERNQDLKFLSRWRAKAPRRVLESGKPFNLRESNP